MIYSLITYKKRNNDIFQRVVNTPYLHEIGDITSNGWLVIDIQIFYNGQFRSIETYNTMFDKEYSKRIKKARKSTIRKINMQYSLKSFNKRLNNIINKL